MEMESERRHHCSEKFEMVLTPVQNVNKQGKQHENHRHTRRTQYVNGTTCTPLETVVNTMVNILLRLSAHESFCTTLQQSIIILYGSGVTLLILNKTTAEFNP